MTTVSADSPESNQAQLLLAELADVLSDITGSSGNASFDVADVRQARALFVVARDDNGDPLGCGAFRPINKEVAEIKRMYARSDTKGVGSEVLLFLEKSAVKLGYSKLWLETRIVNERAVRFYKRKGFKRIENFGKYAGRPEAICMEKQII